MWPPAGESPQLGGAGSYKSWQINGPYLSTRLHNINRDPEGSRDNLQPLRIKHINMDKKGLYIFSKLEVVATLVSAYPRRRVTS